MDLLKKIIIVLLITNLSVFTREMNKESLKFVSENIFNNEISEEIIKDKDLKNIQDALKLINSTLSSNEDFKGKSWENTAYIVDTFGPRLWGSKSLELAIKGIEEMIKKDGFDSYELEEIKEVPVWSRGEEFLTLYSPRDFPFNIPMTGLGLSVGGDIRAEVVLVNDFNDLKTKDVTGKIVFYNYKWTGYDSTVEYRVMGPVEAAKKGALGVIIRSVAPKSWETPHTGVTIYNNEVKKIPACAISLEDADMFERMTKRGQKIEVRLYMEAKFEENTTTSHNILVDLKGTEKPEEIILMGGHIDSWDVGPQTGAGDDLAGFFMCYEALRILTKLNLRPKRTIRLIGWSGEEMGKSNNGAHVYVNNRKDTLQNHIVALESDLGADDIHGFAFDGSNRARVMVEKIVRNFKDYGMDKYNNKAENADVTPLFDAGIPIIRNINEQSEDASEYFLTHHTAADTMSYLCPHFMDRNVMGIAGIVYSIANLEAALPKNSEK